MLGSFAPTTSTQAKKKHPHAKDTFQIARKTVFRSPAKKRWDLLHQLLRHKQKIEIDKHKNTFQIARKTVFRSPEKK
jgi:hypothetical protein